MTAQPLGTAADVYKLQRGIRLKKVLNLLGPLDRDAGQFHARFAPLIRIGDRISEDVPQPNSDQSIAGFLSVACVLRNQQELLSWLDYDRSPTREVSHQTDLNRSANVKCGELLGRPGVQNQDPVAQPSDQLLDCEERK
jgi:hypothetical protein